MLSDIVLLLLRIVITIRITYMNYSLINNSTIAIDSSFLIITMHNSTINNSSSALESSTYYNMFCY